MSDSDQDARDLQNVEAHFAPKGEAAAPAPPRYEVRPSGAGTHGDEFIDGVPTGDRVPLRDHGGDGVILGDPMPTASDAAAMKAQFDEMQRKYDAAEHLILLSQKPEFRGIVEEWISRGDLDAPVAPIPEPSDVIHYRQRMAEPEAQTILEAMNDYAQSLPFSEQEILNSSHKRWNQVYDQMKNLGAGNLPRRAMPSAYENPGGMSRQELAAALARKQVHPGFVEKPGVVPEYPKDPNTSADKQYHSLRNRILGGTLSPSKLADAETELVRLHSERGKPRRSSDGGY